MASDRSTDRGRRALELFESALEVGPEARKSFVEEACGNDGALQAEVEALLASLPKTSDFLESPVTVANEVLPPELPFLVAPGDRFGNFVIESELGAGGMGEVYKANDTRLGRSVAIKILRAEYGEREELRKRFLREARMISNLNHPNICTVYDVGEREGLDYLVMEYLDGETLARRLSRGPLPVDEALGIAIDIADGLEEAHSVGVVHRDLKPGNVMLTSTGAKVLDFGLAKPLVHGAAAARSATRELETREGTILGTPSYMSPQQARGDPVDRQTDIWSFGCILYEALTGQVAYRGDSYADTLVSVLEREPDWDLLPYDTPRRLRALLRRCLEKEPRRRLHDIADARIEIEECRAGESDDSLRGLASVRAGSARRWAVVVAAVAGLSAFLSGSVVWWLTQTASAPPPPETSLVLSVGIPRHQMLAFARSAPANIARPSIAISPDGSKIVYVAKEEGTTRLYLRRLDTAHPERIPGTEGAFHAFFSPDGERIGFFNETGLFKSPLLRGGPVSLAEVGNPFGGTWSVDDTIVYAANFGNSLFRIPADGGRATELTPPEFLGEHGRYLWPHFLPGGRTVLFNSRYGRRIGLLSLDTGEVSTLLEGSGTCVRYARSGHLLYARGSDLYAARMDLGSLAVTGRSVPVLAGVRTEGYGAGHYAVSTGGTIAYVSGKDMDRGTLVWVEKGVNASSGPAWAGENKYGSFRLSPDASRVAVEVCGAQSQIWIYELGGRKRSWRLTSEGDNYGPLWTPDGSEVYFTSLRDGVFHLVRKSADGMGNEKKLLKSHVLIRPQSLSSDGQVLLLDEMTPTSSTDLVTYRLGHEALEGLLRTAAGEWGPRFSPDGELIAYTSDEVPRTEVFVMSYRQRTKQVKVSTNGGEEPIWSSDGDRIFYRNDDRWMAVQIIRAPELEIGETEVVVEGRYLQVPGYSYDYDPDRKRFLMLEGSEEERPEIRIITNWFDRLEDV